MFYFFYAIFSSMTARKKVSCPRISSLSKKSLNAIKDTSARASMMMIIMMILFLKT